MLIMSAGVCFMSFYSFIFFLNDTDAVMTFLQYFVCCIYDPFQLWW